MFNVLATGNKAVLYLRLIQTIPSTCRLPAILEANETLITTQDMLKAHKQLADKRTVDKVTHAKMVQKLSDILSNATSRNLHQ